MKILQIGAAVLLPLAIAGCAGTNPQTAFRDVEDTASVRTGASLRWQREDAAHQPVAQIIDGLLKDQLTPATTTEIALLNNRSLQAAFEEIGISQADLAQASRLPNIEIAGSWRFPNRPPSAADIE